MYIRVLNMSKPDPNKRLWDIWNQMIRRCTDVNHPKYHNYGARGITICDRWMQYHNFKEDMGYPPKGMALDRDNNDGNYEPDNCIWTSHRSNTNNRRTTVTVTYKGLTLPLSDWARLVRMNYQTLHSRVRRVSWPVEKALFT